MCDALRGARARLLRRSGIARRDSLLELGSGWGLNLGKLIERSAGDVTGLDSDRAAVLAAGKLVQSTRAHHVHASAESLPFADQNFDLVFTQFAFLWFSQPGQVASEIRRVLRPDGVIAAIEPDFGGLMEYPPEAALRNVCSAFHSDAS